MSRVLCSLALGAVVLAAGCGQKGPLYLPEKNGRVITAPPAQPPPAESPPAQASPNESTASPGSAAPKPPASQKRTDRKDDSPGGSETAK